MHRFGVFRLSFVVFAFAASIHNVRAMAAVIDGQTAAADALRAEFLQRLHVLSDDSEACITLGAWAEERGLLADAEELYRDHLMLKPLDADVHAALVDLCGRRPLSEHSESFDETRDSLPATFIRLSSRHFVVLSDADPAWVRQRLAYFERAWHQFDRFTRRLGLRPLPLKHKLVCVLFDRREDYLAFARAHDGINDHAIAGYYSPQHDRIVFYNPNDSPSVMIARDDLRAMQERLASMRSDAETAERSGEGAKAASIQRTLYLEEERVAGEAKRVAQFVDQTLIATTIHEAVHQLLFHTRVQSPYVQYPLWISEGLATTFETEQPNQAFGPDHEHAARREAFDRMLAGERFMPLEALVQMTMLPSRGDDSAKIVYHQSYALVTWLVRFRRTEFARYLDLMRSHTPGRLSAAEHRAIFEQAFGEVSRLERDWLRWERSRLAAGGRIH